MKATQTGIACMLVLCAAAAGSARAQDPVLPVPTAGDVLALTLADAQRLALAQSPVFAGERHATAAARGRLRQARTYLFNPELEASAPGVAAGDGLGVYEAALVQQLEMPGRRASRVRAAERGLDRARAEVRDAARTTMAEVSAVFFTVLAADRRLEVARQILALNQSLLTAIRTQRREGEISALQANLAEIEVGRARARLLTTRREQASALLDFRRLAGLAPEHPVKLIEEPLPAGAIALPGVDSLVALALARRPDLAAAAAGVREAEALASVARAEGRPTLRVSAIAEREEAGGDPRFGVGVGTSLPLLNRNQGTVAERRAEAAQAAYRRSAVELRVRSEVVEAVRTYAAAAEEVAVYETDVLRPTRENQALLETAYRAGKIDLPSLLLVRNQLREAELGYWDAWLALRRARVRLDAVTGATLVALTAEVLTAEVAR